MKKTNTMWILLLALTLVFTMAGTAFGESPEIIGEAHFDGKDINSTLDQEELVNAFRDLQPGDDITVKVTYQNDYEKDTEWYMANDVIQTLEATEEARKTVEGTGTPENGGYTYSLVHTNKDGEDTVLFSNDKVGGEAKPDDMEGLEQATNALNDWFYLETLSKGEHGTVTLSVAFEGETEVNDYMDTEGSVDIVFAVNVVDDDTPPGTPPKTGDVTKIFPYIGMMIIGILLLIPLFRRKKDKGGEA